MYAYHSSLSLSLSLSLPLIAAHTRNAIRTIWQDGYTALDLAIWRGHLQIIELLRSQGSIAPMKEPESLNGRVILHLNRKATVVDFEPSTSMRTRSLRALYYEDSGEAKLVNLWAGTDYQIIGQNPYYEDLKKHEFHYADIPVTVNDFEELLQGRAVIDEDVDDSDSENEIDECVEVKVPPGPLGVLLDSGIQECAVVHGFTNLPTGGPGPIQAAGRVVPGMYIIGIDDTNASLMSLTQVTQLLGKLSRKEKVIRFAVFRRNENTKRPDDDETDASSEISYRSSNAGLSQITPPKPAPSPSASAAGAKPPAAPSGGGGGIFGGRFASLAASMLDKKPSNAGSKPPTPGAVASPGARFSLTGSLSGTPKGSTPSDSECVHCGMPASVHKSADCPYR
jgi:hypothetical protein